MASSARSVRSSLLSFIEELSGRCSLFAFRQSQLAFSLRFCCSRFLALSLATSFRTRAWKCLGIRGD